MKYVLISFFLFGFSLSFGQIYRAGEAPSSSPELHWEVAAGWSASTGETELKGGSSSTNGQHGWSGRFLYVPSTRWALGGEGTFFLSQKINPLVVRYHSYRVGLLAQYRLTPDTIPLVYLLAGAGVTSHHLNYVSAYWKKKDTKEIVYAMAGAGLEVPLWQNIFVAVEGRAVYNRGGNLSEFYGLSSRWEAEGKIWLGVRF